MKAVDEWKRLCNTNDMSEQGIGAQHEKSNHANMESSK